MCAFVESLKSEKNETKMLVVTIINYEIKALFDFSRFGPQKSSLFDISQIII